MHDDWHVLDDKYCGMSLVMAIDMFLLFVIISLQTVSCQGRVLNDVLDVPCECMLKCGI